MAPAYTSGKITHDPRPWLNIFDASRWVDNWSDWDGLAYVPRPEFEHDNPILVAFRASGDQAWWHGWCVEWLAALDAYDAFGGYTYWEQHDSPYRVILTSSVAEHAHARRVLSKLAHA